MTRRLHTTSGSCVEARWFIPADVVGDPAGLGPPDRQRVDAYHLASLSARSSWKRRGASGVYERKARIGVARPVTVHGATAVAERWAKERTRRDPGLPGPWIDVRKQVWTWQGGELGRVLVDGSLWWTVAVEIPHRSSLDGTELGRWWSVVRNHGIAASYPAWLAAGMPTGRRRAG